ncbi:hypothetical protein CRI94_11760 [Longibacter salinarum]|uniref:Uncharacterized protein n=1 Tax=Longibacter salinarum TaxID=1850348 RepID=A0A2A8CXK5_9BACT|nr:hypothetical protein [Longibacter salinarum]PEN13307.1 hypothetical protein CRI94_11760 [Longibacter salinarum]
MNDHTQTTNTNYASMLKEVRERQNHGDLTGALNELRKALDRAHESHVVTTLEQHLRLPKLLFQMDRREEAGAHKQAALADALAYVADAYGRFLDSHRKDYRHRLERLSSLAVQSRADQVTRRLDDPPDVSAVTSALESAVDAFTPDNGSRIIQKANHELAPLLDTESLPTAG